VAYNTTNAAKETITPKHSTVPFCHFISAGDVKLIFLLSRKNRTERFVDLDSQMIRRNENYESEVFVYESTLLPISFKSYYKTRPKRPVPVLNEPKTITIRNNLNYKIWDRKSMDLLPG